MLDVQKLAVLVIYAVADWWVCCQLHLVAPLRPPPPNRPSKDLPSYSGRDWQLEQAVAHPGWRRRV